MLLDFFVEEADGRYRRLTDHVRERAYSRKTWEQLLLSSGFRLLAVYGEESVEAPTPRLPALGLCGPQHASLKEHLPHML